jgi:uncharacterized membrane protein
MKPGSLRTIPLVLRLFLALFWGAVCVAFLAAPALAARGHALLSAISYSAFSTVCHQDPGRSFTLFGHALAVCHRCSGIYLGLLMVSLLPFELSFVVHAPGLRKIWIAIATAPMLLDVFLPFVGIWTNTPASRFGAGFVFGAMLASLLAPALAEFFRDAAWRRARLDGNVLGGHS